MFSILRGKKGFTLVELIAVVIIVGVLAAVALPMMSGNVDKAKKSEAMAALGAYRTAFRLYYAEYGAYPNSKAQLATYVKNTDVDGKYFSNGNYTMSGNIMTANNTTSGLVCNMDLYTGNYGSY